MLWSTALLVYVDVSTRKILSKDMLIHSLSPGGKLYTVRQSPYGQTFLPQTCVCNYVRRWTLFSLSCIHVPWLTSCVMSHRKVCVCSIFPPLSVFSCASLYGTGCYSYLTQKFFSPEVACCTSMLQDVRNGSQFLFQLKLPGITSSQSVTN